MLRKLGSPAKRDALSKVPLFSACTQGELRELSALVTELEVPAGQVLCRKGESGTTFFVLVDGTAEVTWGPNRAVSIGPGAFFGELALLDGGPRTATVTMTDPGRVLVLTAPEFRRLLRAVPGIAIKVLTVLGTRIRQFDETGA